MTEWSVGEILAFMGGNLTIEMEAGETPVSVSVAIKTVDSAGRAHLHTRITSDGTEPVP